MTTTAGRAARAVGCASSTVAALAAFATLATPAASAAPRAVAADGDGGVAAAGGVAATGAPAAVTPAPAPAVSAGRDGPAMVVVEPRCATLPIAFVAFVDSLRVELAGRGPSCCAIADADRSWRRDAGVQVTIAAEPCGAKAENLSVDVVDQAGRRRLRRGLSLEDVARSARPRALALVVAEVVRLLAQAQDDAPRAPLAAPSRSLSPPLRSPSSPSGTTTSSSSRLPSPSAPPPPSSLPSASPAPKARSSAAAPSQTLAPTDHGAASGASGPTTVGVAIEGELRRYPTHATTLAGARASFTLTSPRRAWFGTLALGALFAGEHVELGDVTIRCPTLGVTVGPRFDVGPVGVELGARAEAAYAIVSGQSDRSDVGAGTGSNVLLGAGGGVAVEAPVRGLFRGRVGLEAGATLRGVTARVNGAPTAAAQGLYVLATFGARWSPPAAPR